MNGEFPTKSVIVPVPDSTKNNFLEDVVGNKTDAGVGTVGTDKSLMAYTKGALTLLHTVIEERLVTKQNNPAMVSEDETFRFGISVIDNDTGPIVSANITAGTYDLDRIRGGATTNIVSGGSFSKSDGLVYVDISFAGANWQPDDVYILTPQLDTTVDIGGNTYYVPLVPWSGLVTDLSNLEGKVDTVQATLDEHLHAEPVGDVFYVSPSGDDGTGLGTYASPWKTIDYAVGQCTANHNDMILCLPGTYDENSTTTGVAVDVNGITIIGSNSSDNQSRTIVKNTNGAATKMFDVTGDNITIMGIAFEGTGSEYAISAIADGLVISKCRFYNINDSAIIISGSSLGSEMIENCLFIEVSSYIIDSSADYTTIRGNRALQCGEGVRTSGDMCAIEDNILIGAGSGTGITVNGSEGSICENDINNWGTPYTDGGSDNVWTDNHIDSQISSGQTAEEDRKDIYDRIGAPVGADISADIAAIQADVGDPSTRTNLQNLEDMLGNVDESGASVWSQIRDIHKTAIDGSNIPVANTLSDILHKDGSYTYDNTTDSLEAIADAVSGIGTDVSEIPSESNSKTWNSTALQSIQDEAEDALEGENLDHLIKDAVDTNLQTTVDDDSVGGYLLAKSAVSNYDRTTDSLEGISDKIGTPTGADIATDIANAQTDITAIKAITDVIPDSGAMTSIAQESTLSTHDTDIKALLVTLITETTGTFSFDETSAAEQDAITLTISSRTKIGSIWLDMVNVTQNTTIKVYHKIDGSNYRLFQSNSWQTTDDDGVLIDGLTARGDVKVSLTCGGGGAGSVNVPYAVE